MIINLYNQGHIKYVIYDINYRKAWMEMLRSRVFVCFEVKNRSKNKSQEQLKIVFKLMKQKRLKQEMQRKQESEGNLQVNVLMFRMKKDLKSIT